MSNSSFHQAAIAVACLSLGVLSVTSGKSAEAAGDLWQVTSQMSMPGMPFQMPAQTQQVCAKKQWTTPPTGNGPDRTCTNTDFATNGNTSSWKIACQNPPMTGTGQITRTGEGYTGAIKFNAPQGEMTVNLTGRRMGDCNNPS